MEVSIMVAFLKLSDSYPNICSHLSHNRTQLSQDLPNYAQHMVPIHSLGQEWLWCETWCGRASRPRAKTIDLCNNPLTKEPKLQSARRIIAEWPALDREAREFTQAVRAVGWLVWWDNCVSCCTERPALEKLSVTQQSPPQTSLQAMATQGDPERVRALMQNDSLYRVELLPMVEGVAAERGAGHDASEL